MDITVAVLTIPERAEMLGDTIKTIVAQSIADFELLIVDNGAEDNTASLRERFTDSRVRVIRCGGSIAAARNLAAGAASGEFIAFVDDDDEIAPDYLELLLCSAREHNADIAVASVAPDFPIAETRVFDTAVALGTLLRGEISCELTGKLLRRSLFGGIAIPEERTLDGTAAGWRFIAASKKTALTADAKYHAGRGEGRVRLPDDEPKLLTANYIVEHLGADSEREEYIAAQHPELISFARYKGWAYMLEMVEHITALGLASCYAPLRYMRNELKTYWREVMNGEFTQDIDRARMKKYV